MNFAVVGTGIIANAHIQPMENIDEITLVAVCDINEESAKKFSDTYGVPYWTDYKVMADEADIDAVILNLPHFLHKEASVFFLERGINVLCEKPMANTVEECDAMIRASEKSGAKLAIGHIQRFCKAYDTVREYVQNKTLGELCMATESRTAFYFPETRPKWFLDKKLSGGGMLMNYGAHALDTLSYIIGNDFTDITGTCGNIFNDFNIEGHAQFMLKINGKISASITFSGYISPVMDEFLYYFDKGVLKVVRSRELYICDKPNGAFRKLELEEVDSFGNQLREFIKYIKGEPANIADGYYARKIIEVIRNIYSQNNR